MCPTLLQGPRRVLENICWKHATTTSRWRWPCSWTEVELQRSPAPAPVQQRQAAGPPPQSKLIFLFTYLLSYKRKTLPFCSHLSELVLKIHFFKTAPKSTLSRSTCYWSERKVWGSGHCKDLGRCRLFYGINEYYICCLMSQWSTSPHSPEAGNIGGTRTIVWRY